MAQAALAGVVVRCRLWLWHKFELLTVVLNPSRMVANIAAYECPDDF